MAITQNQVKPSLEESRSVFKLIWKQYALAITEERRQQLDHLMTSVQKDCVRSLPDGSEDWEDFRQWIKEIPNYCEHWESKILELNKTLKDNGWL